MDIKHQWKEEKQNNINNNNRFIKIACALSKNHVAAPYGLINEWSFSMVSVFVFCISCLRIFSNSYNLQRTLLRIARLVVPWQSLLV